jgi:hypothetical protein
VSGQLQAPAERASGMHWIGGWMGPKAVESRTILPFLGLELRPLGRPARTQSLHRLRLPAPIRILNNGKHDLKGFVYRVLQPFEA